MRSINDAGSIQWLRDQGLDILFVIGWSQIVKDAAMAAVRIGLIGAHASLLPRLRGSAPINWALIRGEQRTGNTLMWLHKDVDAGDIIDQREFPITEFDTCATLYDRVAETNREMILAVWPRLQRREFPRRAQPRGDEATLPRRRPEDGRIAWDAPNGVVYDLIRALTRPYPGAFTWLWGRRWTVWRAALLPAEAGGGGSPGEILGSIVSPVEDACGLLVSCGRGFLAVLELQCEDGVTLRGRDLARAGWRGARFADRD
jgi:methionyl-tRNA formyltransferase